MEDEYEGKLSVLEKEISKYKQNESELNAQISVLEKHETELVEKVQLYEKESSAMKVENEKMKLQIEQHDGQSVDSQQELELGNAKTSTS